MRPNRSPVQEYDWWQANPSEEVAAPVILSFIFNEGQECHWMADRRYDNDSMFDLTEKYYRQSHPLLFDQLAALAVTRAATPAVLDDCQNTMKYYYRGAVIGIKAIEASLPGEELSDLTPAYVDILNEMDMIDIETWLLSMRAETGRRTQQLRGFIAHDYGWPSEVEYYKTAMQTGAQHAYILLTHSRACVLREQELAWQEYNNIRLALASFDEGDHTGYGYWQYGA